MKLSLIIPAYNEEKRIKKTLEDYVNFLSKKLKKDFEILVIINNSTDNTLKIVQQLSKKYPQIKYINYPQKLGKGGALIKGFNIAKGDLIGFVDADCSTPPRAFYELVEKIKGYDGIIGSRWVKGAKITLRQPISRRIASRGFNLMVRTLLGINIKDTQCGNKVFRKEAIKKITPGLGITMWAFDIDLLYLMKKHKYKILEIPTEWHDVAQSKLDLKRTIPEMFLSLMRLRLIYSPFKFIVTMYDRTKDFFVK